MVDIFNYTDYREFLKDYYNDKKSKNSNFSYRMFAEKAGYSNPGFYIDVVKGKRALSKKMIEKMIKALNLSINQEKYFRYLVMYNQATSQEEKDVYNKKILAIRAQSEFKNISYMLKKYYENWYIPIIREIIAVKGFNGDFEKLAQIIVPKITKEEAKKAIDVLLDLELIKYKDNEYSVTDLKIKPDISLKKYIRNLQKVWIKHADWALDNISTKERNISSIILSISEEDIDKISEHIDEFRTLLSHMSTKSKNKKSKIYQLNLQFFPRSEGIGRYEED